MSDFKIGMKTVGLILAVGSYVIFTIFYALSWAVDGIPPGLGFIIVAEYIAISIIFMVILLAGIILMVIGALLPDTIGELSTRRKVIQGAGAPIVAIFAVFSWLFSSTHTFASPMGLIQWVWAILMILGAILVIKGTPKSTAGKTSKLLNSM
jgi:EamA domain-containing membrane protein RarD